ncbi:phosphatidate cytidylyltransferase [Peptoclostridium litorale DSM 5388]|uniref:Phosphatidate cytidylyltransferase n=1 Tax=Peptoclostridium litorale DSM 5388 TaxID=1121324 RepID=A0A069REJ6_PEPLI|nr:phosphatidate cytidylyltransferase [Peptoclostridium litorale]KDR95198.1 phosphatidate cytidylyltransferase CdsA [Peptoclostridium litorale DSM 5388]SIN73499.1 phosphatidate cytidylyltransferase [Peptoclostridium litorale DSM 5388]
MLKRIVSSILLLPLLFFIVIKGGFFLNTSILIISLLAIYELYEAFKHAKLRPIKSVGYIATLVFYMAVQFGTSWSYVGMIAFMLFFIFASMVVLGKRQFMDMLVTIFGIIYISYALLHIGMARSEFASHMVWIIFITAWATDTCAYFAGCFFGKHKLIPSVSPKKTIEGSVGGIAGSVLSCMVFGFIFEMSLIHMAVIGFTGSIVSQMGDLFASSIKRYIGIKDYGNVIPGHGGMLDRFDSIIFSAPLVYYYISIFMR